MAEWYDAYLASAHWERTRREALERSEYRCESCGWMARRRHDGYIGLNVHHLTYERLGGELPDDLVVLCWFCHGYQHGKNDGLADPHLWMARRVAVGGNWETDDDEIPLEVAEWDALAEAAGF